MGIKRTKSAFSGGPVRAQISILLTIRTQMTTKEHGRVKAVLQLQEAPAWGHCCQRRVNQLLTFSTTTVNVEYVCIIKTLKSRMGGGGGIVYISTCEMKIRSLFYDLFMHNTGWFQRVHILCFFDRSHSIMISPNKTNIDIRNSNIWLYTVCLHIFKAVQKKNPKMLLRVCWKHIVLDLYLMHAYLYLNKSMPPSVNPRVSLILQTR